MESIYVLYDNKYFGEGYFIVSEVNGKISKFLKISMLGKDIYMRAFEIESHDNDDMTFRNIDFSVNEECDLYPIFSELYNYIGGENVFTIDYEMHGDNHISMSRQNDSITLTLSKDICKGKEVGTEFIVVNFGDVVTNKHFRELNTFYNDLSKVSIGSTKEGFISKVLKLK